MAGCLLLQLLKFAHENGRIFNFISQELVLDLAEALQEACEREIRVAGHCDDVAEIEDLCKRPKVGSVVGNIVAARK